MLKKILVPTDGYKASVVSIDYAINIAKLFDAQIIGLSVIDIKRLTGPFIQDLGTSIGGMVPYVNFKDTLEDMLKAAADTALMQLEEKCKEKEVSYELKKEEGIISSEITKLSADTELIVMGKTGEHTKWVDGLLGSNLESVVRRTHKPILVASEEFIEVTKILAAYDGSEFAGKAIKMSGEIANKMKIPMTILTVGDKKEETAKNIQKAVELIKPFNVEFDTIIESGDPVDIIFDKFKDGHYNMLVMGAYGHSKIRELIVGSTTVQLMRKIACPLLISR